MTIKKRILAACLMLAMLVCMLPGAALAAADVGWSGTYTAADNNNITTVTLPTDKNRIEQAWSAKVGNGTIVVVGDYIYTYDGTDESGNSNAGGTLYKINKATGEIVGSKSCTAGNGYYYSYLVYGGGLIYVGCRTRVMAVDPTDLTVKWETEVPSKDYPTLQLVNGFIVTNGTVLNASTGEIAATLSGTYEWSNGVERNGMFYVAATDGNIRAFDTTTWEEKDVLTFKTGQKGAGVAFFGNRLYWGGGNSIYSVQLASGGLFADDSLMSNAWGGTTNCTPAIAGGRVYLPGSKDAAGVVAVFKSSDLSFAYIAEGAVGKIQSSPIVQIVDSDAPSLQSLGAAPLAADDGNYVIVQDYGDSNGSKVYVLHDTATALSGTLTPLVTPEPVDYAYEQLAFDTDGALYCTNDAGYLHKYVLAEVKAPVISTDLSTVEVKYTKDALAAALTVTARSQDGGTLSYQWQSKADGGEWANISGATRSSYNPSTSGIGTTLYRCIVTNTIDGDSKQTVSAEAKISVTAAAADPTFSVEKVKTCEDTAKVNVYLTGNPGIIAAKLYVDYDSEKLELTKVEDAGLLKGFMAGDKLGEDPYLLLWEDSLASGNNTASGKLVTLSFKAKDGFSGVESAISVSYAANEVYDAGMNNVTFKTEAGSVAVGHKWTAVTYTWADDHSTCTAVRTCTVDGCEAEEKEVSTASKNVTDATETEDGSVVYTAEFENTAFETQTYTEVIYAIKAVFSADKVSAAAGSEVTVGIYVAENPGIIAAKLYVDYDGNKLELTKVEDAGVLKGFMPGDKLSEDPFLLLWEDSLASGNNTANGKLATLSFKVKESCRAGDVAAISISFDENDVYDFDMNNVTFRTEAGSVTVTASGDTGGEGGDTGGEGGDTGGEGGDTGGEGGGAGGDTGGDEEDDGTISVYFTLKTHKATWISRHRITLDAGATVADAFHQVLDGRRGFSYDAEPNYVKSITYNGQTLGQFDEGPNSGWKYMVNGVAPGVGMLNKVLEDGDELVWYYVTDYTEDTDRDEGGGGGASEDENEDTTDTENEGSSVTVAPEATVSGDKATANVGESDIDGALEEARKDETVTNVTIAPTVEGDVSSVTVELPKTSVGDVAQSGLSLTVETDIANIKLPVKALEDVSSMAGKTVAVSAEKTENGAVNISVAVDGNAVEKVNGGIVVTLPAEDDGKVLVLVAEDGTETVVKKSVSGADGVSALIEGSATVKLVDNKKSFNDTEKHWGKSAIDFATSHELFDGVADGVFDPNGTMTRAMLVTVLYRLEDAPEHDHTHDFADVADGMWYTDAVAWANANGIVEGDGNGFDPDGKVSREQIAVILHRYAEYLEMSTHHEGDLTKFVDHHETSDWAKEGKSWAVGAGLITGKDGNRLDPTGDATRAEVATILERLVKLMME